MIRIAQFGHGHILDKNLQLAKADTCIRAFGFKSQAPDAVRPANDLKMIDTNLEVGHNILPMALAEPEDIGTFAASEPVAALLPFQDIKAGPAHQHIAALPPGQAVIPHAALDPIIPALPI